MCRSVTVVADVVAACEVVGGQALRATLTISSPLASVFCGLLDSSLRAHARTTPLACATRMSVSATDSREAECAALVPGVDCNQKRSKKGKDEVRF